MNWQEFTKISLHFPNTTNNSNHQKYTSKREDRKLDWSPDFRYLLVPNLDDKVIPTLCALDRHNDFQISHTFIGPFSSINCIKFSPLLFNVLFFFC